MRFQLGDFALDEERLELRHGQDPVEIQPKVLSLLIYLVRHRDRVVSKDELLENLWGDVTVLEEAVTVAIHECRAALGDSGAKQWAIKTFPRRGYRMVADVGELADAPPLDEAPRGDDAPMPHSEPATSSFVGRAAALAKLSAALEGALAGSGSIALVTGHAGIGKTRLIEHFGARAIERGASVYSGWCPEADGAPPFWPWTQVLRSVVQTHASADLAALAGSGAAELATIVPSLGQQLPNLPAAPVSDPEQAGFRMFDSVAGFLRNVAARRPAVLLFDDIHWADRSSLRLLGFLAREVRASRLLIVATYRDDEVAKNDPLSEALAETTRHAPGERVALAGLDSAEVGELIQRTMDADPPMGFVESVADRADGNPFFVKEIVGWFQTEGPVAWNAENGREALPPGVVDVIDRRLRRRSRPCAEALELASAVGRDFRIDLLERLSGLDDAAFEEATEEARGAALIEEHPTRLGYYRFSHALVRETLYARQSPIRRMELHGRIATALEELYAQDLESHAGELSHHYFEAATHGVLDRAIEYATRAGARAMTIRAYDDAVAQYERALRAFEVKASGDESTHCDLLLALGEAAGCAGDRDGQGRQCLLAAADLATRLADPERLARAALAAGGPFPEGKDHVLDLLERALEALGERTSESKARVLARLSFEICAPSSFERGLRLGEEAIALAQRLGSRPALAEAMFSRSIYRSGPDHLDEHLAIANEVRSLADETGSLDVSNWAHQWHLIVHAERGDIAALDEEIAAYRRFAREARLPEYGWFCTSVEVMRTMLAGDLVEADRQIMEDLPVVQAAADPGAFAVRLNQLAWLRMLQGRLPEVAPFLGSMTEQMVAPLARPALRPGLSALRVSLGEEEEATRELDISAANDFDDLPRDSTVLTCVAFLSETCDRLRDVDRARILYDKFRDCPELHVVTGPATLCLGSISRYLGILAKTLGLWEEAEARFAAALEANGRIRARPWLALTQLDHARMLMARGLPEDRDRGLELAQESGKTATALGMLTLEADATSLVAELRGAVPLRGRRA